MRYVMQASAVLVMLLMPLNGCAKGVSDGLCLHVASYTATEQAEAAKVLAQMEPSAVTARMLADYGRLREEARALCR